MGKYIFGVDVGGTAIKIGLFSDGVDLIKKTSIATPKEDINVEKGELATGDKIIPAIANEIVRIMKEENISAKDILAVGAGIPGPIDSRGYVLGCPNLSLGVFDVKKKFEFILSSIIAKELNEDVKISVYPLNDADSAGLGEKYKLTVDEGKIYSDIVFITLGTGVGGAVISDGKLALGSCGGAGEIGHIIVNYDEEDKCGCGHHGCLEQYASATGIVRLAKKYFGFEEGVTAKDIFDKAKENDETALKCVDLFAHYLAKGVGNICSVVNPEVVIIGGGVSAAGDIIIKNIEKYYKNYVFPPCENVKFSIAKLGNDAGIYGAACFASDNIV